MRMLSKKILPFMLSFMLVFSGFGGVTPSFAADTVVADQTIMIDADTVLTSNGSTVTGNIVITQNWQISR